MSLPIVFINLARDQDRRHRMEAALAQAGLHAERLEAVWWSDLPADAQAQLYSSALNQRQYHQPLVNGEKGCYASHLLAWRKLLDGSASAMVILEDDVRLTDQFAPVIQTIEKLEPAWDMVKLIGRPREKIRARQPLTDQTQLIEYQRIPSMTAGYVISRSGATKLLAARMPFGRPIDVDLRFWWECDLRILGVMPPALVLDETSFVSSIGEKHAATTASHRWRKFRMKLALTLGNAWHSRSSRAVK